MDFLFGEDYFPNNAWIIFWSFPVLHRSLMGSNIVSKCGNDSLMFQNIFFTWIPYLSYL
jgi:hypothetical protein